MFVRLGFCGGDPQKPNPESARIGQYKTTVSNLVEGVFLDVIRTAHRDGDLSDVRFIKQALLYQNYTGSSLELQRCLGEHPLWASLDPTEDSPGYVPGVAPPFVDCAIPVRWLPAAGRTARFELVERTIKGGGTVGDRAILANARIPAVIRCAQFEALSERGFRERPLLWIYERSVDAVQDPVRLLMDLGLFHALGASVGAQYFLFDFACAERRKPTWADADLAWYFDAASDAADHGWTRSLVSGERVYQEWVTKGEHFQRVVDVLLLDLTGIPAEPAPAFWAYHRRRIQAARSDHGSDQETQL